jgi:transcriptional antiterminator RfaH
LIIRTETNLMEADISYNLQPFIRARMPACWYAIYTRPHHEKKIYEQLKKLKIDSYLPLQTSIKQWSDRKKKVSEPLFSCYLFVNISLREYYKVLSVPGVIRFVTFEGKAVAIKETQIQTIKDLQENNFELEETVVPIRKGSKVRIVLGILEGIDGELVMYNNKKRVIIRIEQINKSLFVNVPLNSLKLVG